MSTWSLLLIISMLTRVTLIFKLVRFTSWLSIRTALMLLLIVLIVQLSSLLSALIGSIRGDNKDGH
ncbi:hypothetical protein P7D63_20330 [Enterococcus raffinosus]|uniref:hypothetical protein n=1 Tax=Enterococcus raffinosus TaxID=71452 RepID=UPI002890BFCF|nr:hypothetical protein [Enterococcus raffinosus]MDT2557034.1 hypothetical protein [Enterococcus raffinosus]